jgi:uncharacterized protein (TIGR03435 family)
MNTIQFLSTQIWVQRLGWALVHFLWQGSLIAAVYAVVRRMMKPTASARARYVVACIALAVMMAAPIATLSLTHSAEMTPATAHLVSHIEPPGPTTVAVSLPEQARTTPAARADFMTFAVMLWLAGTGLFLLRLMGGWAVTVRMRSISVRLAPKEWQQVLDDLSALLQFFEPVRLLVSTWVQVPTVVGWLRPVVLVPVGVLTGLPPEHVRALLLHELEHIRRNDYFVNILQSVVEALLFYHPAVWWVSADIRAERELCCDDVVVSVSGDALNYALALTELESFRPTRLHHAVAANGGSLPERIGRLLGQSAGPTSKSFSGSGIAVSVVLLVLTACAMLGQSGTSPRFDVASIKPTSQRAPDVEGLGAVEALPGGRLIADKVLLRYLIQNAYGLKPFQISGGPAWINSAHYDIEAKSDRNPNAAQMQKMTQTLLEDRFKLKVHRETRELPVYSLTIAKSGLRLQQPQGACITPDPNEMLPPRPPAPGQTYCGRVIFGVSPAGAQIQGENVSMGELARVLSNVLGRIVVDNTGIAGGRNVHAEFAADDALAGIPHPAGPGGARTPDPSGPSIFSALPEQLGLRLESTKGPVEVLVIDQVERPSEN